MQEVLDQAVYYLDALWRRRWLALGTAFVVAVIGWGVVATLPNVYETRAKIFVDTASVLNPLLKGVAVDNDIEHQLAIMRETLLARPNLEEVARQTDMDLEVTTEAGMESLITSLTERIDVIADKTNIFTLTYTDTNPQRAHDVVQTLMTMFVENNLGRNRQDMETAQGFLNRQIRDYENKLDQAEQSLATFKQKHMELLPGQSGLQQDLSDAKRELASLQSKLSDAQTKRSVLQRELSQTPEMLTQQLSGYGSGPPTNVEAQIMETRARLESLRSRYTDQHPDVQAAQRHLDSLMKELEAQPGSGPQAAGPAAGGQPAESPNAVRTPNPTYSELRLAMVQEESEIETLRQQIQRQQQAVAEIEGRLQRVPEVEAQLQKLNRDYDVIKSQYETLLSRRESAQISSDREQQSDSVQFRIVEPPQVPTVPAGPNRALYMAAVLVVSLGAGVGTTWLLALMKTTYGSINHLRRDFDLPVIGTVSQLPGSGRAMRATADGVGLALAGIAFLGVFGALLLLERQVGLPALLDGQVTPGTLKGAVDVAVQGLRGGG